MQVNCLSRFILLVVLFAARSFFDTPLYGQGFTAIGVDQGLSQNTVFATMKDRTGYLWVSTGDGLNRYDGSTLKVYRVPVAKGGSAANNLIRCTALEDERGNIWFTTETGIYYVDYLRDSVITAEQFERNWAYSSQYTFLFYSERRIWFAHHQRGVGSYDILRRRFSYFPFPVAHETHVPLKWRINARYPLIWYVEPGGRTVHVFDVRTQRFSVDFRSDAVLQSCAPGRDGSLLCFDGRFVYRAPLNGVPGKPIFDLHTGKPDLIANALVEDDAGNIWLGTSNRGLFRLGDAHNDSRHFPGTVPEEGALSSALITSLYLDSNSILWIGTDGGGLVKYNLKPPLFRKYPGQRKENGRSGYPFVKSFSVDSSGMIWSGTEGNGILVIDSNGVLQKKILGIGSRPLRAIGDIFRDRQNRLWVGHAEGIARYEEAKGRCSPVTLRIPDTFLAIRSFVLRFLQRKNGDLLCATTHGLLRLIPGASGTSYAERVPVAGNKLPAMLTDLKELEDGDLLIAAPPFGLFRLGGNAEGMVVKNKFLENFSIRCICPDAANSNRFWLATEAGLLAFDLPSGRFELYDARQGLANNFMYGIVPDRQGNLWVSTNNGLARFDTSLKKFSNFPAENGLQSREFNSGAYCRAPSGYLYFGGIRGLNWFNPDLFYTPRPTPSVALSGIRINGNPFAKDSSWFADPILKLNHRQGDIDFSFSPIDFSGPVAGKVYYRLSGWNDEFLLAENGVAYFRNLAPGDYILEYHCVNSWGDSSGVQRVAIKISPPFWQTLWFYVLCGVLLARVTYFMMQAYARRKLKAQQEELRRQNELSEERMRISREMHDDIGAGLTQIALMSQTAMGKAEQRAEVLKDIADTSRQLVQHMGEIIWSLNDDNRTLDQFTAYLRETLHRQLEYSTIAYRLDLNTEGTSQTLGSSQKRNLLLVIREMVNNAVKHSGARHLEVSMRLQGEELQFSVADDGRGFIEAQQSSVGSGLKNIRDRMALLGGSLVKREGSGTVYEGRIPLK